MTRRGRADVAFAHHAPRRRCFVSASTQREYPSRVPRRLPAGRAASPSFFPRSAVVCSSRPRACAARWAPRRGYRSTPDEPAGPFAGCALRRPWTNTSAQTRAARCRHVKDATRAGARAQRPHSQHTSRRTSLRLPARRPSVSRQRTPLFLPGVTVAYAHQVVGLQPGLASQASCGEHQAPSAHRVLLHAPPARLSSPLPALPALCISRLRVSALRASRGDGTGGGGGRARLLLC